MTEYIPLTARKYASKQQITPEVAFWKSFTSPVIVKENNSVTSIHFSPNSPTDFAVTASTRVQIYSSRTNSVSKSISRFTDTAYSGSFRSDGKLVVAGDNSGLIQLFDVKSRSVLRTMKEHRGPVKVTKFHPDNTKILSCSDDRLVKVWDIPSQAAISTFDDHNDYVRCGAINPANPNVYLSGSYDNTVKIYDARNPASSACILTLDHGAPVEDVLVYPTGSLLAVAGGPCVKIYDIITGRCLHNLENFQKTVTCLALDGDKVRLLAGSLDHHVKVYDLSEYSMQHSVKYPSPVLSLAISSNNSTLAVGMVSGALSIRKRITTGTSRSSSIAFKEEAVAPEVPVPTKKKSKNPHDRLIRDFKYKEALDSLLMTPNSNDLTMELLRELIRRGGIEVALSGRDDASLLMLLKFLANNFNHVEYHSLILNVIILTLDIYDKVITSSNKLNKVLIQLKDKVQSELTLQKEMVAVSGLAEMVKAKAMTK